MSQKQNLYVGRAGQMAVMAEFLLRGWNVALPEVDIGEDIFVGICLPPSQPLKPTRSLDGTPGRDLFFPWRYGLIFFRHANFRGTPSREL